MQENIWDNEELIKTILDNKVVVMPTDTIYGMVGRAESESVVERIYAIRKRDSAKPLIILIGSPIELEKFSISLSGAQKDKIPEYWPASAEASADKPDPTSVVLDCPGESFAYLHRGTKTLAFRLPAQKALQDLLLKTGPLVAPSANIEKYPNSVTISDAKKYFGNAVDLYVDGGPIASRASRVIRLHTDGSLAILRE